MVILSSVCVCNEIPRLVSYREYQITWKEGKGYGERSPDERAKRLEKPPLTGVATDDSSGENALRQVH